MIEAVALEAVALLEYWRNFAKFNRAVYWHCPWNITKHTRVLKNKTQLAIVRRTMMGNIDSAVGRVSFPIYYMHFRRCLEDYKACWVLGLEKSWHKNDFELGLVK
jgi:hypothetical protein